MVFNMKSCLNCENRNPTCHTTCVKYFSESVMQMEEKDKVAHEKKKYSIYQSHKKNVIEKTKGRCAKRLK